MVEDLKEVREGAMGISGRGAALRAETAPRPRGCPSQSSAPCGHRGSWGPEPPIVTLALFLVGRKAILGGLEQKNDVI